MRQKEIDMEEKLQKLYEECINELKTIDIDVLNDSLIGKIDIKIAPRSAKRYGACRQEEPDLKTMYITKRGRHKIVNYSRFKKHHIEISKWVMDLDEQIIKNTIMHELIHCLPDCNNHGARFKYYASLINQNLYYNITRLGNREEDYKKSRIEFKENENNYNYKIVCDGCRQTFYRQRLQKNFERKYRCGLCGGILSVIRNY